MVPHVYIVPTRGWLGLIPIATAFARFCPLYPARPLKHFVTKSQTLHPGYAVAA